MLNKSEILQDAVKKLMVGIDTRKVSTLTSGLWKMEDDLGIRVASRLGALENWPLRFRYDENVAYEIADGFGATRTTFVFSRNEVLKNIGFGRKVTEEVGVDVVAEAYCELVMRKLSQKEVLGKKATEIMTAFSKRLGQE